MTPDGALDDPEIKGRLISLIKKALTLMRLKIKDKLLLSVVEKMPISELYTLIAPRGFDISLDHWKCACFLRKTLLDFRALLQSNGLPDGPPSSSGITEVGPSAGVGELQEDAVGEGTASEGHTASDQFSNSGLTAAIAAVAIPAIPEHGWSYNVFWHYIDVHLERARTVCRVQAGPSAAAQAMWWMTLSSNVYAEDLMTFPDNSGTSVTTVAHSWQLTIEQKLTP
ncbi:hypothetical protein SERLADRAFT_438418 [Serpula lacrymans var. lacrymans S7.9]|uniref:Uncharacterized protein n=1 Tax=Serpula lacrymans var. lacrymans (strain S7.9) TaxID=578457 RepID=F8NY53_SERL9|nr:uncharacterized protein SERLADRAFT_438418 [Serpula lacrymans var. lacrymans S7.9]EGO24815.1 hypothetical protein SERLADRAFT_438418 [Serpula lacrymans var. lacrymans S7.9]